MMKRRRGLTLGALLAIAWAPSVAAQASGGRGSQEAGSRVGPRVDRGTLAGTVRTDTLWSQSLGTRKALTVYLPPSYDPTATRRYPVLLYLHGLGGNERNWVDAGQLHRTMDSLVSAGWPEAIIAMPDGDDSWYTTFASLPDVPGCQADTARREPAATFCVPWPHYDDYVARDIVGHLDATYRTRADRAHRAIAGLSMGGYGAVTLALAYPDVFAAAASHSGVLSPRLLPADSPSDSAAASPRYAVTPAEFARAAGRLWPSQRLAFGRDSIAWTARDPRVLLARLAPRVQRGEATWPALYIDVGVDDPWLRHNRDFNAVLAATGVPRRYGEYFGGHTWTYWRAHAEDSLTFLLAQIATP
ncbi:MAG: alpha/beta hydrolase [Gemmatimonadaceae bacterium]